MSCVLVCVFFFFSSRRRHTRWTGDWSSDVCSSDLGAEKLDFREVYAIDGETAYLLSIGKGNESRIYKTTDAGKNWLLTYTEQNPKAFLDCMAFWDGTHGIVVGDPLDGKPELLTTSDGGAHWASLQSHTISPARNGEGSPASGSCIATYAEDRKSTRLNSSHPSISYAVFCLKKKKKNYN